MYVIHFSLGSTKRLASVKLIMASRYFLSLLFNIISVTNMIPWQEGL